ncbi:hypothetical protein [Flammeovirga sp. SJP92]|uniref:hypothetical protein n=1 Tax=Flammeovirga sp. SJP92 TaxID=1775430 RepID=UPI000787D557|nr:hypothetical protein [Flammeovirga sp. SJP92]KXX71612.1 hypothetical protein AVL50_04890 [Flammeovirga sp. SJP92]
MKNFILIFFLFFSFNASGQLIELQMNYRICTFAISSLTSTKVYNLTAGESFSNKKDYKTLTLANQTGVSYTKKTITVPSLNSTVDDKVYFMYDPSRVSEVTAALSYDNYSGYNHGGCVTSSPSSSSSNKAFPLHNGENFNVTFTTSDEGKLLSSPGACNVVFHFLNFKNRSILINEVKPTRKMGFNNRGTIPYLYKPEVFNQLDEDNKWVILFSDGSTVEVGENLDEFDFSNETMVAAYVKGTYFKSQSYVKDLEREQLIAK